MFALVFQSDVLPDTTLVFIRAQGQRGRLKQRPLEAALSMQSGGFYYEKKKKNTENYLLSDNQDVYILTDLCTDARLRSISCRHILPLTLFKHQPATIVRLLSCSLISGGFFFSAAFVLQTQF